MTADADSVRIPPALDGRKLVDRHPDVVLSRDDIREIAGRAWDLSDEDLTSAQDEGGDRASVPAILAERDAAECLEDRAALYAAAPDLLRALEEANDVLHKLAQSMRIEGRREHENYARHGCEAAMEGLRKAGVR